MLKRGVPAAVLVSDVFEALARAEAQAYGYYDLPLLVVEHPIGTRPDDVARSMGVKRADDLAKAFGVDIPG